jgi:hypothetical protein
MEHNTLEVWKEWVVREGSTTGAQGDKYIGRHGRREPPDSFLLCFYQKTVFARPLLMCFLHLSCLCLFSLLYPRETQPQSHQHNYQRQDNRLQHFDTGARSDCTDSKGKHCPTRPSNRHCKPNCTDVDVLR